jgi:hypothetical protein
LILPFIQEAVLRKDRQETCTMKPLDFRGALWRPFARQSATARGEEFMARSTTTSGLSFPR